MGMAWKIKKRWTSRPTGPTSARACARISASSSTASGSSRSSSARFCKDTGTLDLFLPTEFSANWVADRFADRLSLAWKIARSEVRQLRIAVHPGRRKLPELRSRDGRRPANDGATPA